MILLEKKILLKFFLNIKIKTMKENFLEKFNLYLKRIQLSTKWYTALPKKLSNLMER